MSFWNLADFSSSDLQANSQIYFRFLKILASITLCALLFVHSSTDSIRKSEIHPAQLMAMQTLYAIQTVHMDKTQILAHTWFPLPLTENICNVGWLTWKISCFPNLGCVFFPPFKLGILEVRYTKRRKFFVYNSSSDSKFYLNVPPSPGQDFSRHTPGPLHAYLVKQPKSSTKILIIKFDKQRSGARHLVTTTVTNANTWCFLG